MEATLEKEVNRLGRSSQVAAGITLLGVVVVGFAMAYAVTQLRTLQQEVADSEARLRGVKAEQQDLAARVRALRDEVLVAQSEKKRYQDQAAALTLKVQELQRQLEQTTDMSRFQHPVDLVDWKMAASQNPAEAEVLRVILELRHRRVRWNLAGSTPEDGFTSPSLAAYVLRSLRSGGFPPRGDVWESLRSIPRRQGDPEVGDLVFYPGGYALFYFRDQRQQPFVIGMTPSGIVALKPDFAPRESIARPNYRR